MPEVRLDVTDAAVILSFRVSRGRGLGRPVVDSVTGGMLAA